MIKRIVLFGLLPLLSCTSPNTSHARSDAGEDVLAISDEVKTEKGVASPEISDVSINQDSKDAPSNHYVSLYDGKFKISIPVSFEEMSSQMIMRKYPNSRSRPGIAYGNDDGTVNVAFTYTTTPTEQEDLPEVKEVLSQQLQAARPDNFQSRIEKIGGSDYVVFEFESQAMDTKIYNLMFATDVDGKLLVGTFNCVEAMKEEWEAKAKAILSSVRKK